MLMETWIILKPLHVDAGNYFQPVQIQSKPMETKHKTAVFLYWIFSFKKVFTFKGKGITSLTSFFFLLVFALTMQIPLICDFKKMFSFQFYPSLYCLSKSGFSSTGRGWNNNFGSFLHMHAGNHVRTLVITGSLTPVTEME